MFNINSFFKHLLVIIKFIVLVILQKPVFMPVLLKYLSWGQIFDYLTSLLCSTLNLHVYIKYVYL